MKYYDNEFRKVLMELLISYRKFLEQASLSSKDQNYINLVNDIIKRIDEYMKIVKPSAFDFLSVGKIEKLQEDEFLKQKALELEQNYKEKLKSETDRITEKLKTSICADFEKEYAEKLKAEIDSITVSLRQKITEEVTVELTEQLRLKLTEEIRTELKRERDEKKKRKKAKKEAKAIQAVLPETFEAVVHQQKENSVQSNVPVSESPPVQEKKFENIDEMPADENIE